MKNYCTLLGVLLFSTVTAQITHQVTVIKKISHSKFIIKAEFINESDQTYIIPLDTTGLKAYYPDEICGMDQMEFPYKYFAPAVLLHNQKGENVHANLKSYNVPEESMSLLSKEFDSLRQQYKTRISEWAKKEHISDFKTAEQNFYIMNNLIVLKPGKSFTYEIVLDLYKVNRSELFLNFDSYMLTVNSTFTFRSLLCADKNIYSYLTKKQKKQLKKYKLFKGIIESNRIVL
ncbi:MAG: hypothetical protein K0M56_02305 [Kaistella sp.]|nr:hypothetical protein [Kaistella sp.]